MSFQQSECNDDDYHFFTQLVHNPHLKLNDKKSLFFSNLFLSFISLIPRQDRCLDWFPRLRAISLAVEDVDGEQNEWKTLQGQVSRPADLNPHSCFIPKYFQLDQTQKLVQQLSSQLADLRDQMTEQRKHKQRMGLLNSAPSLINIGERH